MYVAEFLRHGGRKYQTRPKTVDCCHFFTWEFSLLIYRLCHITALYMTKDG